ncbi:hypothetical protein F5Y12DRAFT_799479 [Xylaria sp. FL1777]|nr:hypothetical protein F5Y12DRAFT_799479 [Xylaria sp. FL1777]
MLRIRPTKSSQLSQAYYAAAKAAGSVPKAQPWKAFWPLSKDGITAAEQSKMPWLTWKPDPARPDDKPWRAWMLAEQSTVVRRGSSW